jgi:multiple sugar transport system permease protein
MTVKQPRSLALAIPTRGTRERSARRQRLIARVVLLAPALIVILATTTYPLISAAITSFRDWQLIYSPDPGAWVGFQHYTDAFKDTEFINSILVTLEFTVISVALSMILALAMALVLYKPGIANVATRSVLILPFAVSAALKGYSWRFMLDPGYGVYSKMIGFFFPPAQGYLWFTHKWWSMLFLAMSEVWGWAPLMALMFIGGLSAISTEIFEAARVDGANAYTIFVQIMLPLLRPILFVAMLLKIIFSLKLFDQIVTMTGGGPGDSTQTLNYYVYQTAFRDLNMGYASALAIILVLALSVFSFVYVRVALGRAE